jgi:hypothetical protein
LTESELGLSGTVDTHSKNGVLVLPVAINPNAIPADHYTGTIHLLVENLDDPVTVPIDFSVRNEPYFALLAILVGIALGRLSNYLQGRGRDTLNAYRRAHLLGRRVERQVKDTAKRAELLDKIAEARQAIADDDLDAAKVLLDQVEASAKEVGVSIAKRGLPRAGLPGLLEKISPVEAGLGLGTHLLGLLVYLGLLVIGFQTLYVNQGATFGSNGIFDYVGLILWGLTADVASRGLGNLAGGTLAP